MISYNHSSGKRYLDSTQVNGQKPKFSSVVSLFTGAGGLDIGLEMAGFDTKVCVEIDTDCRETLRHNRPEWVLVESSTIEKDGQEINRDPGDIRMVDADEILRAGGLTKGKLGLVVGGAPCQPFSNIGKKKGQNDKKNGDLFLEFVRVIDGIQPQAFIFENVVGITQKKHDSVIAYMKDQLKGMGYALSYSILNAADYGVPQKRERFFLIGIKGESAPAFPLPTHSKNEKSWKSLANHLDHTPRLTPKPWVSIQQAFHALPKGYKKRPDYALMNISDTVKHRMTFIKPGENFKVLPIDIRPNCWKTGKHQGQDTFGRLRPEEPSVTIRTAAYNPSKGKYIHPFEDRGLDTIELAALQSFPADWEFKVKGRQKITLVSGGKQIGNAVPPLLAYHIGNALRYQMAQSPNGATSEENLPQPQLTSQL